MTDNRTTELRMKLTEHGVNYEARDSGRLCATSWIAHGTQWNYRVFDGQSSLTMGNPWLGCTPEQSIAATLGSEREIELSDALNEVAERWAIAQVEAQSCAKRCILLEELVRDMWFWGYEGHMGSESQDWQMKHIDGVLDRMKALGIEMIDE